MRGSHHLSCAVSGHMKNALLNGISMQNCEDSNTHSTSGIKSADNKGDIRRRAMDLLARREHSRQELRRKLYQRFSDVEAVESVLDKLKEDQLLSDARFAESYVSMRRRAGFGPVRISGELRERGVSENLIGRHVDATSAHWNHQAETVRTKKFGTLSDLSIEEQSRQSRFLQYRGFTYEQINSVFASAEAII